MTRTVTVDVPVDTSLFTPLQAQPNALLSLGMSGWARWLHEHWVSFPRLVGELGLGVVIAGFDLEYTRPLSFFDSEALVATAALRAREDGGLFYVDVTFASDAARSFARGTCVLRPVKIGEGVALSAVPANVGREILARFAEDEIVPRAAAARTLPRVVTELNAGGPPLAVATRPFTIHRHQCEVADQWSAIAMPDLAAVVREEMIAARAGEVPALGAGLQRPLRRLLVEFRRAAFFLDQIIIAGRAFTHDGELVVHYEFALADGKTAATLVEWF